MNLHLVTLSESFTIRPLVIYNPSSNMALDDPDCTWSITAGLLSDRPTLLSLIICHNKNIISRHVV